MKKLSVFAIFFLVLISSIYAIPYTATQNVEYDSLGNIITPKTTFTIGNYVIDMEKVDFTCHVDPTPATYYELSSTKIRTPPQGNFYQSCQCIQQSVNGGCARQSCTITSDEQNNPNCWVLSGHFINKYSLIYMTPTEISPFITANYGTNAEWDTKIQDGYRINLAVDIDTNNGMLLSLPTDSVIDQNANLNIYYDNEIADNLKGGIEVKEENAIFFIFSRVTDKKFTFNRGKGTIQFKLDNAVGNKKIVVTPYVLMTVNGNDVKFAGNEYSTITKVAIQHETPIYNTVPYNYPNQNVTKSFLQRFNDWFDSLFGVSNG